MRRFVRAVWAAIRAAPRPTGLGLLFLVLFVVLGAVAIAAADPVLLLAFGLVGASLLLSIVLSVRNLERVVVERDLPPHCHAGERFWVTARIALAGRRSDAFGVMLTDGPEGPYARPGYGLALRVTPAEPALVRYRVRMKDRGRHAVTDCILSTRHPFGLFEHRVRRSVSSEMLVFPRVGIFKDDPLPGSRFARTMTSSDTVREKGQEEFRNIREYRMGDNPRLIAWKATARHAELMVKELEDDLTKKVTIFLESRLDPGARTSRRLRMERAISFAATLLRKLARRRYWLQVYYFDPKPRLLIGGKGARQLDRLMEGLAVLEPTSTGGVQDLVARAPGETFMTSLPVLVLPTLDEGRLRAALDRMPGRRAPVVFRADGEWERSIFKYHEQVLG